MKRFFEGILYILLIVGILGGLIIWLDYFEVLRAPNFMNPLLRLVGLQDELPEQEGDFIDLESPWIVERIRIQKERESLDSEAATLLQKESELDTRTAELDARETALLQAEGSLEEQKKTLNQVLNRYEDKSAVIRQNAQALQNMPPEDAVEILNNYEDQHLIDVLRMTDRISGEAGTSSIVPFWLSLLPPDRAAQIQRKMTVKPQGE